MSPPLTPDADDARRQLADELSRPIYTDPESWLAEMYRRLLDWLTGNTPASGPLSNGQLTALIVVAVVVAGIAVWAVLGPVRSRNRQRRSALFVEDERTAAEVRAEAEALAAAQNWSAAYVALFRAMIRTQAERGVITEFAGMTAQEAVALAKQRFPDFGDPLAASAGRFDSLAYDHGSADQDQYRQLSDLDAALVTAIATTPAVTPTPTLVGVESAS